MDIRMGRIKRRVNISMFIILLVVISCALQVKCVVKAGGYYDSTPNSSGMPDKWEDLNEVYLGSDTTELPYVKLNVEGQSEGANSSFHATLLHQKSTFYGKGNDLGYYGGNALVFTDTSRVSFAVKMAVEEGTVLSVVAASDDNRYRGGSNTDVDNNNFYWAVVEYAEVVVNGEKKGLAIYDGDWRSTDQTWVVGSEKNDLEGHEISLGYGITDSFRRENVTHVMIVVRVASGDKTQGANQDLALTRRMLYDKFPNMYVVVEPFKYTFLGEGGTVTYDNESSSSIVLQRLGITPYRYMEGQVTSKELHLPTAVRNGYRFKGWKIDGVRDVGKQDGNIYIADGSFVYNGIKYAGDGDILSNGKYYTSLYDSSGETVFKAQWECIEYNIQYILNGGIDPGNPKAYTVEEEVILKNPTRDGYIFLGWICGNGNVLKKDVTINKGTTGDLVYEAYWEPAAVEATVWHYVCGVDGEFPNIPTKINTISVTTGKKYVEDYGVEYFRDRSLEKANAIIYSGYEFPVGGVVMPSSEDNIVKIYYIRKVYEVTFNVSYNYGYWDEDYEENRDRIFQYYYGTNLDISMCEAAVRQDAKHIGWSADRSAINSADSLLVTQDITLYALFERSIVVGFTDSAGRDELCFKLYNREKEKEIIVPYLDEYSEWSNVVGVLGVGWTQDGEVYTDRDTYGTIKPAERIKCFENVEYYGVYKGFANVSFNEDGGVETEDTKDKIIPVYRNSKDLSKTRGACVVLPNCERNDHNNSNGTITTYSLLGWEYDGIIYPVGKELRIDGNTEFVAIWDDVVRNISYTIVYDMNGGYNGPDPVCVRYGEDVIMPAEGTRVGFCLSGWSLTPDNSRLLLMPGDKARNFTRTDGAVVTLFAQWSQREFMLVKVSSSRYGATFIRRRPGDELWFNNGGNMSIKKWECMSDTQKEEACKQHWKISKEGQVFRIK